MELLLNLVWLTLCLAILCQWRRFAPGDGASRRVQWAAVAMLIVILFPVISVTDDLEAAQNPAEVESVMRRDHSATAHSQVAPSQTNLFSGTWMPATGFEALSFGMARILAPRQGLAFIQINPALAAIENRPPPAV
jgi:hypothetical protein